MEGSDNESESEVVYEPITLLLARKQAANGHSIWIPPEEFAILLRDILSRFCRLDEKRCVAFEMEARYQKLTAYYHLPELTTKMLQTHFGLMLGEAFEFRRVAKWIAVHHELRVENGRNE